MFPFLADFQSGSLSRPLLDGRLCILNASLGTWCSLPECQEKSLFFIKSFHRTSPLCPGQISSLKCCSVSLCKSPVVRLQVLLALLFSHGRQCLACCVPAFPFSIVSPSATCTRRWHLSFGFYKWEALCFFVKMNVRMVLPLFLPSCLCFSCQDCASCVGFCSSGGILWVHFCNVSIYPNVASVYVNRLSLLSGTVKRQRFG